ncbi:MAG TPA: hypothetical protein VF331_20565 [Polyangiales bacterium]
MKNRAWSLLVAGLLAGLGGCGLSLRDKTACATTKDCLNGYSCVDKQCVSGNIAARDAGPRQSQDGGVIDAGSRDSGPRSVRDAGTDARPDAGSLGCGTILHVSQARPLIWEQPTGASWSAAYPDLAPTLQLADEMVARCGHAEVWVAQGRYLPSVADKSVAFVLKSHVEIYGGFAGTETSRAERDWHAHETVLSGDFNFDDGSSGGFSAHDQDNSFAVVQGGSARQPIDSSAVLDGFVITGASTRPLASTASGAIYLDHGAPTLRNLVITDSFSPVCCAGDGVPHLEDIVIAANAGTSLSALDTCAPSLERVVMVGNTSESLGGGGVVLAQQQSPTLTNMLIAGNWCGSTGVLGSMSSPKLDHVIVAGNFSWAEGGHSSVPDGLVGFSTGPKLAITNSIIWGNSPNNGASGVADWDHSCTQGRAASGSNVDCSTKSPFRAYTALTGTWSARSTYDEQAVQTVLHDDTAHFAPGALAGLLVQFGPDPTGLGPSTIPTNGLCWGYIVSNTDKEVRVWGFFQEAAQAGDVYTIRDLRPATDAQTIDQAAPGGIATDILGQSRLDVPGTTGDVSTADIGAYEYVPGGPAICLAKCP